MGDNTEFTIEALKQKQSLPLEAKVVLTQKRVEEWYNHWDGEVYLSFSGGKDSTVLKHIIENTSGVYDVPSVFFNTGLEYPEIQEFVRSQNNVTIIRPEKSFKQVIDECGYPIISKEIAETILYARRSIESGGKKYKYALDKLNGTLMSKETGKPAIYNCPKWKFLLDAPFKISHECCKFLKKNPAKKYGKETNRKPITATMACESMRRKSQWLQHGCNGFNMKSPISNPMSFWTEQDVLKYLYEYKIPYCKIYGEIDKNFNDEYRLTGVNRTGCMFCMFGVQLEKTPNRFQRMKESHPQLYKYCMEKLGIKEVLEFLNIDYE
ncbi:MAG: phosphoadenosine phosphosulfate reductase family protein [Lachnospiraceae bacterium]|nr:phosphoadenosine phosphosulfate reductase family protein [Lachnospiraceae bacterium]